MTDDNSNLVDIPEDLSSFKALFEGREAPKVEDTEDNALATDEDTDASNEDEVEDQEDSEAEEQDESEDESEDEESEDESEEEAEEEPKDKGKKPKSRYQTRIDELTRTAREAERREAALLARLEALETKEKPVQDSPQESPLDRLPPDAPNPDAVDAKGNPKYPLREYDPQYIFDLTKFAGQQAAKELEAERARAEAERQANAERDTIRNDWNKRLDAAEEEIPEIREHIAELVDTFQTVDPRYGEYLATLIMTSDTGPAIMEYLSQNIGEAQKIVASGPTAATLAIGRLEAKLQNLTTRPAGEEKRNKKPSGAPKPPVAVTRGTKGGKVTVSPDTEDLAAFKRDFFS